ncbi:MAG: hypothetical protein NT069_04895, partial [Planctomycetota bacterium]|nr:hypothetical protein [Planctomycetota bacterium]
MSLLSPWRSVRPWAKSRAVELRVWCLALAIVFALADVALCQSREETPWSAAEFPEIRRLFVPADDPGAWPEGNWEPRPTSQFLKELQGARAASRRRSGPPFVEAIYEATLLGDSLRDGRLRWKLAQRDLPASFVDLAPLELPLDDLAWDRPGTTTDSQENPVVFWGRATDGRLGFCTTPGEYRLAGSWGLDGRRLGGILEFQFKLPPATVSTIDLRLPLGMTLSSSRGTVAGPKATEDVGWSVWQVALGQSHECRLRITRAAASPSTAGLVVSRPDLRFNVRPESTRFRALFDVASWEATTDQVAFEIPPEAELSAVTYGDSDVVWRREGESREKLVLALPTPARGSLRRIELQGILPPTEEPGWRMPMFRAIGALELEGHIAVRLAPSFRAAALRFTGLRQFVYETSQDDEVFEFRRLRSDATLEFVPASRPVRLACRSVGWLNLGDENQFQGDLEWSASEGRTWSATCTLSDDWEVIDARIPATDRSERLADWSLEPLGNSRQRLLLHLSDALEPEHPLRVRVVARSRSATVPRRVALPILAAETDLTFDNVQLVTSDRGTTLDVDAASQFDRLVPSELPPEIRDIEFVRIATQRGAREFFALQSRSTHSHGVVEADAARAGAGGGTLVDSDPVPAVANSAAKPQLPSPVVAQSIQAVVDVCGEESGFDSYRLEIEILGGTEQSELRWRFPTSSEPPAVVIDGQPAIPVGPISDYRHGVLLTRKTGSRESTG